MVPKETNGLSSQMRRGAIEYCVLAILWEKQSYGIEIAKSLAEANGLVTSDKTIYPLLARLSKQGYVKSTWKESHKGPPRRYYELTNRGAHALNSFTLQWHSFRDAVDCILSSSTNQHFKSDRQRSV